MSVRHLARTNSYHHPILLRCSTKENEGSEGHTGNKPFRVLEAWYSYKSFSELVQNAWAGNHHDLINSMKCFHVMHPSGISEFLVTSLYTKKMVSTIGGGAKANRDTKDMVLN